MAEKQKTPVEPVRLIERFKQKFDEEYKLDATDSGKFDFRSLQSKSSERNHRKLSDPGWHKQHLPGNDRICYCKECAISKEEESRRAGELKSILKVRSNTSAKSAKSGASLKSIEMHSETANKLIDVKNSGHNYRKLSLPGSDKQHLAGNNRIYKEYGITKEEQGHQLGEIRSTHKVRSNTSATSAKSVPSLKSIPEMDNETANKLIDEYFPPGRVEKKRDWQEAKNFERNHRKLSDPGWHKQNLPGNDRICYCKECAISKQEEEGQQFGDLRSPSVRSNLSLMSVHSVSSLKSIPEMDSETAEKLMDAYFLPDSVEKKHDWQDNTEGKKLSVAVDKLISEVGLHTILEEDDAEETAAAAVREIEKSKLFPKPHFSVRKGIKLDFLKRCVKRLCPCCQATEKKPQEKIKVRKIRDSAEIWKFKKKFSLNRR